MWRLTSARDFAACSICSTRLSARAGCVCIATAKAFGGHFRRERFQPRHFGTRSEVASNAERSLESGQDLDAGAGEEFAMPVETDVNWESVEHHDDLPEPEASEAAAAESVEEPAPQPKARKTRAKSATKKKKAPSKRKAKETETAAD